MKGKMNYRLIHNSILWVTMVLFIATSSALFNPDHALAADSSIRTTLNDYTILRQDTNQIAYIASIMSDQGLQETMVKTYDRKQNLSKVLYTVKNDNRDSPDLSNVQFSPDGSAVTFLASSMIWHKGKGQPDFVSKIQSFDLNTGKLNTLLTKKEEIHSFAFAPDGRSIFITMGIQSKPAPKQWFNFNSTIFEYNLASKQTMQRTTVKTHGGSMRFLKISRNGKFIYTTMTDPRKVKVEKGSLDVPQQIYRFPLNNVHSDGVQISPTHPEDINNFSWNDDETILYYSTVTKHMESTGDLEFEIFAYYPKTKTKKQMTSLGTDTENPIAIGKQLFFTVDTAGDVIYPNPQLTVMNINTGKTKSIILPGLTTMEQTNQQVKQEIAEEQKRRLNLF
ncbi:hypothetical protein PaeCFBP13512_04090 [Paenibacillus sp. CFBP13512]|uniref:hypothetical protein n=1 Tax=Paenibacillus sp. CFBP13512 TaxID=2184007 RepID=UPI0010BF6A43|nr:hypothetical protein [Paenibacillus sp. CFBP13512]TKJ93573.1 hypothetical protein PaeCFBP13512_04090 [Paenibacillus sp. CFBP13512]